MQKHTDIIYLVYLKVVLALSGVYPYFFIIARWIIALCSLGIIGAWIHYFIKTKSPRTPIAALIVFSDKSFITEKGMYNAVERTFTDFEGNEIEDDEYLSKYKTEVNNMFLASAGTLDNDYYGIVFGTRTERIK